MSIATIENRASVRALDAWNAETDALEKAEQGVAAEIVAAFGILIRHWPAKDLLVPTVQRAQFGGSGWQEGTISAEAAITEQMNCGYCMPELIAVLEKSDCPLVQQLREALGKSWAKHNASDIAPYRVNA